jgi:hypothetical protein
MQMLGLVAFGGFAVVNLIVFGLVLSGLFRHFRSHG